MNKHCQVHFYEGTSLLNVEEAGDMGAYCRKLYLWLRCPSTMEIILSMQANVVVFVLKMMPVGL